MWRIVYYSVMSVLCNEYVTWIIIILRIQQNLLSSNNLLVDWYWIKEIFSYLPVCYVMYFLSNKDVLISLYTNRLFILPRMKKFKLWDDFSINYNICRLLWLLGKVIVKNVMVNNGLSNELKQQQKDYCNNIFCIYKVAL